jgi:hypothetical protein
VTDKKWVIVCELDEDDVLDLELGVNFLLPPGILHGPGVLVKL